VQALLAGVILLGLPLGWFLLRRQRSSPPAQFANLVRLTSDPGYTGWPDISRDGKLLVYSSNRADPNNFDIYLQPVDGNQSIRLTDDPARDIAPVISPDGSEVAFESYRDPPGIYVVPLLGGEARLLARGGSRPRYSPDGAWIAYLAVERAGHGSLRSDLVGNGGWSSWIIPASGGEPKALHPELQAGMPLWVGNDYLILTGSRPSGPVDWWLTPRDGSWAKPLGIYNGLAKDPENFPRAWSNWTPACIDNGSIIFSARKRDGANLWRIRFSSDWEPKFPPERVTMMNEHVRDASISANGRMTAGVMSRNIDVYEMLMDANTGSVKGGMHRLTWTKTSEQFVTVSGDGSLIAYTSWRKGDQGDLYLLNPHTGVERQLTATIEGETFPRLNPDGTSVIYRFPAAGKHIGRRMHLSSGSIEEICQSCAFMDYTANGTSFLFGEDSWQHIFVKDFSGDVTTEPVHDEKYRLGHASLDGLNRWIAFVASLPADDTFRIFAAPFRRDGRMGRESWIEMGTGLTPLWSPNGEWLYFDEGHDGFRCLWKQRFNPAAGKRVGNKIAIAHLHGDKRLLTAVPWKDRGLASDRIVFSISEETSNIWLSASQPFTQEGRNGHRLIVYVASTPHNLTSF
jgi:dipeptidyl aminopeptidase/acylaminoacyl peptidase